MNVELSESAVKAALSTRWLGHPYHFYPEISSTNAMLKEMVVDGDATNPAHGTVLSADSQSQGKGRLGRSWWAPPGTSLLLSILLRPSWNAPKTHWLTISASLAVAEAMEELTGLTIGIKWPNDLLVWHNDAWSKVSGLLVEGDTGSKGIVQTVIVGVGINVNIRATDFPETLTPSTSLMECSGQSLSRIALLVRLLQLLEDRYEILERGHSPLPQWKQRLVTLGQEVRANVPGTAHPITGVAEDTDRWGHLQIRDQLGHLHTVSAGDVSLRQIDAQE